ncbi:hypothetical protein ACVBEF_19525 [Glaciimonas sp. GG7]
MAIDALTLPLSPAAVVSKYLSGMTSSTHVKTGITIASSTYNVGSGFAGVVGRFFPALIPQAAKYAFNPLSTLLGGSGAAAAVPFLPVISRGVGVLSLLHKHRQLDPLLSLWLRYDNSCSCCGSTKQVTDMWENGIANKAMMANVFYALYLSGKKLKNVFAGIGQPSSNYVIAEKLWNAGKNYAGTNHQFINPDAVMTDHYEHCPLALLALATLFGKGDASKGYPKAVAALMSDQASGIREITKLLS